MKQFKTILTSIFASAMALCSCNDQEIIEVIPSTNSKGVIATFQQPIVEGEATTRALNNNLQFSFEEDAQINVYPSTSGECMIYALTPTEGSSASFNLSNFNMKDATYGAVYPVSIPAVDPTQVKFSLAGQNQVANDDASHLSAYDLNYAKADIANNTGVFNFAHKVAWLKISVVLNRNANFKDLRISADEGLSNTLTLNTLTGAVTATPKSSSEKIIVTLNGTKGINVTAGTTLTVYAAIPAGNYTNLTIWCGTAHKTISGAKVREAGHAYPISLIDSHNLVDLGLESGLLWSENNLGVETKNVYGLHYAWGYTTGYYFSSGWTNGTTGILFNVSGVSEVTRSDLNDSQDAAVQALGGKYRMPTKEDFDELVAQTTHEWTTQNGVNGVLFISKKDSSKKIFFPACGYAQGNTWYDAGSRGNYRTRTLYPGISNSPCYCLFFEMNQTEQSLSVSVVHKNSSAIFSYYKGYSIRPVYDPKR